MTGEAVTTGTDNAESGAAPDLRRGILILEGWLNGPNGLQGTGRNGPAWRRRGRRRADDTIQKAPARLA